MIRKIIKSTSNNTDMKQPKGMYWNGTRYVKSKPGAYDGTETYRMGGDIEVSYGAGRPHLMHGGDIEVPYMGGRPKLNYGGLLGRQYANMDYSHVTALAKYGGELGSQYANPQYTRITAMMKDGGIHIKPENKGKFTAWASAHGMGVQEAARHVMANKEDYSPTIVKRANFAKNAASFKHQYGGITKKMKIGGDPYDEDGGVSLPSSGNAWGSSATNTQQQMDDTYAPVAQANQDVIQVDPNQNTRQTLSGDRANMDETPVAGAENLQNPYDPNDVQSPEMQQSTTQTAPMKQRTRPFGTGYRDMLAAAMIYGQGAADRRQAKQMKAYGIQQGMTQMSPVSNPWGKGQYNQQGQLSQAMQPVGRFGRYGGKMPQYAVGGVYEMTDDEIQKLQMGGYKLKMC